MIMCMDRCQKHGKIDPLCVAWKCGKAAVGCLTDTTCVHAATCVPKAVLACSEAGFKCIFGESDVCLENLKCLGNGIGQCADPAVNVLTDRKIADFIECAGSKCPKPVHSLVEGAAPSVGRLSAPAPAHTADQLLCISEKCGSTVLDVFKDEDTSSLLHCAHAGNLTHLCSSVWKCLGDRKCAKAVHCWSQPLTKCAKSTWHMLTDRKERQRLLQNVACLRSCQAAHPDDFISSAFCILDKCSKDLLACQNDKTCWSAVQCLPQTAETCAMPTLDAYVNQPLFEESVKCLGRGLQTCGRRAMGMVQDLNIAKAVQCASQCTRPSGPRKVAELIV